MRFKSLLLIAILPIALILASEQLAYGAPVLELPNNPATDLLRRREFAPPDTVIRSNPSTLSGPKPTLEERYLLVRLPRDQSYKSLTNRSERANLNDEFEREYSKAKSEGKLNRFITSELSWIKLFWQSRQSAIRSRIFQNYKPQTKSKEKDLQDFLLTSLIDTLELQCRLFDEATQYPRSNYKFSSKKRAEYLDLRAHQKAVIELKKMNKCEGPLEEAQMKEALAAVATN